MMSGSTPEASSHDAPTILQALKAVGELLAAEGEAAGIVIVGGTALILQGFVERLTEDVDVIAITHEPRDASGSRIGRAEPLPQPLTTAIARVARDFNLPETWMNSTVTAQWDQGLPPGFEERIHWQKYGGLVVGVAHRRDLIFLKLYAAVDSEGPESVHYQDLLALRPSHEELEGAATWVRAQDTSVEFASMLDEVVSHVRRDR